MLRPLLFVLILSSLPSQAQWLNQPSRKTPRTKDGKPDLFAKAPRLAGRLDLSGVWQVEPPAKGEIERMLGDNITVGLVPGDDLRSFSKYFFNVLADFKPEEYPLTAEAREIMRNRPKGREEPDDRCLPLGVPRAELIGFPIKIVQAADELVILQEVDNTPRQIYTDGRKLPADPNPSWLGYSVARWERDTLVVDSAGFTDKVWIDTFGHPTSEALHIEERFHRRDFGHMDLQITITDPKMFSKPVTFSVSQFLLPDTDILENFCQENEKDRSHLIKGN